MKIHDVLKEFVMPQAQLQDPELEKEKDADVIVFGSIPTQLKADQLVEALEELLPAEYPTTPGSQPWYQVDPSHWGPAPHKMSEVRDNGGAVVTTKPLSEAKKLVASFNAYGIKARVDENLREFAPDGDNGGEEESLHKYAKMWYNGDDATKQQVEQILDRMGWEIGPLESEEGGCFVVRPGDENGDTYIGFTPEELAEGVAEAPGAETLAHNQSTVASNEKAFDLEEGKGKKPEQPEADYGDDYQDMVKRVKKLAGLGPMKTVYDPAKRVYKNMPTAVQPKK